MAKTKLNPFKKNRYEIYYQVVNSALAGVLVLIGSLANGQITSAGVMSAILAFCLIFFTKFSHYWKTQQKEFKYSYLNLI